jgi:excisionase family DNA binding protein
MEELHGFYMTIEEAATLSGRKISMISRLCREGRLSGVIKMGAQYLIPRQSIESYTPMRRGRRTNKERLAADLSGIREEIAASKGE